MVGVHKPLDRRGRRLLFNAGTQEVSAQKVNCGVMNLNATGRKIFLNSVVYMMTPLPTTPTAQ